MPEPLPAALLEAEWLEADGLGGFASGTVAGVRTRRYHALLLAATTPPTGPHGAGQRLRRVARDRRRPLRAHLAALHAGRRLSRRRARASTRFDARAVAALDASASTTARASSRRSSSPHGRAGASSLRWRLLGRGAGAATLARAAAPLAAATTTRCTTRTRRFRFDADGAGERVRLAPVRRRAGDRRAARTARYAPRAGLVPQLPLRPRSARAASTASRISPRPACSPATSRPARRCWILAAGDAPATSPSRRRARLIGARGRGARAPRAFPIAPRSARPTPTSCGAASGSTIVAGYPWFTDWGRDTFIALRGLCLADGPARRRARRSCSRGPARSREGMLPNRFPDRGEAPEFNAVDASLWFVVAVHEYLAARRAPRRRRRRATRCAPRSTRSSPATPRGTRYGIRCDDDGLLAAGEPGVQLTWMDAKVGDWVVTPRIGKPVEVQALWLNALCDRRPARSERWRELLRARPRRLRGAVLERGARLPVRRRRRRSSRRARRPDASARTRSSPSAACRSRCSTASARAASSTRSSARLWTPLGLRSLAPDEPGYAAATKAASRERDGAYHQGTVWPWLLGPFVEAWVRVRGDDAGRQARGARALPRPAARPPRRRPASATSPRSPTAMPPHTPARLPVPGLVGGRAAAREPPGRGAGAADRHALPRHRCRLSDAARINAPSGGTSMLKTLEAPTEAEARAAPRPLARARRARAACRGRERRCALEALGAVPRASAMGHRARGLQRRRRRLGLLPARPRPQPGLSLGRGRHRRHQRRPAAALPGAGPVERHGPDPQGAPLRPDQQRGQPRRGRQGAVLLPRRHADALLPEDALQVSAGASFPTRGWSRRTAAAARTSRSSSCSTPASSTTTATSTSSSNTPRPAPDDILMQVTVHNRGPEAATIHLLPQLWFRNTWSWKASATAQACVCRRDGTIASQRTHPSLATTASTPTASPSCSSATTRRTSAGCSASDGGQGYFKDAFHEYVVHGDTRRRQSRADRAPRPRRTTDSSVPARRSRQRPPAADARRRRPSPFADFDAVFDQRQARGRRVLRRAAGGHRRRRRPQRPAPGLRRHDLEQAVLLLRRAAVARRATRRSRRRRPSAGTAATATGSTSTTPTSSPCRTSGNTPGTPPGTWRSTASRWP